MKNVHEDIKDRLINVIKNLDDDFDIKELHNEAFNTDSIRADYSKAEEFLRSTDDGIFGAIEIIIDYENYVVGEVPTDYSDSVEVCNMYAYIKGEQLIHSLKICLDDYTELGECRVELLAELEG